MIWAFLSEVKHYYVRVRVKMDEKNTFQIWLLVVFISGAVCHSNVEIPEWAFFQHGIVAVAHNRSTIGYPHVCTWLLCAQSSTCRCDATHCLTTTGVYLSVGNLPKQCQQTCNISTRKTYARRRVLPQYQGRSCSYVCSMSWDYSFSRVVVST